MFHKLLQSRELEYHSTVLPQNNQPENSPSGLLDKISHPKLIVAEEEELLRPHLHNTHDNVTFGAFTSQDHTVILDTENAIKGAGSPI